MVKLGISVEGATELGFVKQVLIPYLLEKGILMIPVSIGGRVSIDSIHPEINRMVNTYGYATTLYDFYGFRKKSADDNKKSLEAKMLAGVKPELKHRVIPYVQMYEFEGLLFTSPEAIASVLENDKLVKWAQAILKQSGHNPEAVNDSAQTAPSKRFEQHTDYSKVTDGPRIAKAIGIDTIRENCQGFNDWLTKIEAITE